MPARFLDPVGGSEFMARILYDPDDWNDDGLTPRAITTDDLRERERGWSVQRIACAPHMLQEVADKRLKRRPDLSVGKVAIFRAGIIREIAVQDAATPVDVEPNPYPDNEAHAIVIALPGMKNSFYKKVKAAII